MQSPFAHLAHHLFPTKKNEGVPKILHHNSLLVITVFALGVLFTATVGFRTVIQSLNLTATVYPNVLVDMANKNRSALSLVPLQKNVTLENAARLKAQDMANNGYFSHTSPTGITPWHWFDMAGYTFVYAGENLALHYSDSDAVHSAWLNSPTHRDNILNTTYSEIGIATLDTVYEGVPTTFVVELFGTPAQAQGIAQERAVPIKKADVPPTTPAITQSSVAGATKNIEELEGEGLVTITETPPMIEVEDTTRTPLKAPVASVETYHSSWYERLLFNPSEVVSIIYSSVLFLILIATASLAFREYERKHAKHFIYSGALFILVGSCLVMSSLMLRSSFTI